MPQVNCTPTALAYMSLLETQRELAQGIEYANTNFTEIQKELYREAFLEVLETLRSSVNTLKSYAA